MSFGNVFRYNCQFPNGDARTWRVLAESKDDADIKLNEYICHCGAQGLPVPSYVEYSSKEDPMILY